ncbi:MAG: hypothetical protein AAF571_08995 [Verrucomicrobiota bacterium]
MMKTRILTLCFLALSFVLPLNAEDGETASSEEVDVKVVLGFIEDYLPLIQKDLEYIQSRDEEFYEDIIERLFEPASDQEIAMKHYPEQFAQEAKILEGEVYSEILAWKYRQAQTSGEKQEIQKAITELVTSQFQRKLKRDQSEVQELDTELGRLKELIEQRQANRDTIIQRRVNELTGEADHLDW